MSSTVATATAQGNLWEQRVELWESTDTSSQAKLSFLGLLLAQQAGGAPAGPGPEPDLRSSRTGPERTSKKRSPVAWLNVTEDKEPKPPVFRRLWDTQDRRRTGGSPDVSTLRAWRSSRPSGPGAPQWDPLCWVWQTGGMFLQLLQHYHIFAP